MSSTTKHKRGESSQYMRNSDVDSEMSDSQIEDINAIRRLVSEYRSQCKRLKVELNDWKSKYSKDIKKLTN